MIFSPFIRNKCRTYFLEHCLTLDWHIQPRLTNLKNTDFITMKYAYTFLQLLEDISCEKLDRSSVVI